MGTLSEVLPLLQFPDWLWNLERGIAVRYHPDCSLWVLDMNTGYEYPAQSVEQVLAIVGEWTANHYIWVLRKM
ncbi:hypothetical protein [Dictyobacter aurantiacus]|uniref:Uncharacterized protein n=1 Tax=Dictyobacter aurantiacus TaxID=1936993 RepID=A0A401ZFE9_9CHLR|nr:hypothetical protein [Dictyobacter aurantiacus]GCE05604.1 hypothetical protein KDAU_29330 [Dictyobacter aurantiacus]